MSVTETFEGRRYDIVAWARGHETVLYEEFGSFSGEWLLVSFKDDLYYIWKGYYGSCSGCDSYEAEMSYDREKITREKALDFAKDYDHFLEVPRETILKLIAGRGLLEIFPANIRTEFHVASIEDVVGEISLTIKLRENVDVTPADIVACKNQELGQMALKRYGYEKFIADAGATTISQDGESRLLDVHGIRFVSVKDSSTARRYLLRVPPAMQRCQEAIAWTFGMKENEYRPEVET
jgi:hypothetical protein